MTDGVTARRVRRAAEAGASPAWLACVATGDVNYATRKTPETDGERPAMGHFGSALWDGEVLTAWRRADSENRRMMRAAGVAP